MNPLNLSSFQVESLSYENLQEKIGNNKQQSLCYDYTW